LLNCFAEGIYIAPPLFSQKHLENVCFLAFYFSTHKRRVIVLHVDSTMTFQVILFHPAADSRSHFAGTPPHRH
jgi:hypothetical protein